MKKRQYLSDEEKAAVVAAYVQGDPMKDIGQRFDTDTSVVLKLAKQAGIKPRQGRFTAEQRQLIIDQYLTGDTINTIAARLTVNPVTIYNIVSSTGHVRRQKQVAPAHITFIVDAYQAGKNSYEIGKELNYSNTTILNVLKNASIEIRDCFKFNPDEEKRIIADYVSGETSRQIASRLNVSSSCIIGILKRHKVARRQQEISQEIKRKVLNDYQNGKLIDSIANETGLNINSVTQIIQGMRTSASTGHLRLAKKQMIDLYQSGQTAQQVADQLGLSRKHVNNSLKKMGLSRSSVVANRLRAISLLGNHEKCYKNRRVLCNKIRNNFKYADWRKAVFERDNHVCQHCGTKDHLQADHIYPFSAILHEYKITSIEQAVECNLLWRVDNGRVLCKGCHKKTDTFGAKAGIFTGRFKARTKQPTTL